jgi:hypothetical protein
MIRDARRRSRPACGLPIWVLCAVGLTVAGMVERDTTATPTSDPAFAEVTPPRPVLSADITLAARHEPPGRNGDSVIRAAANQLFAAVKHTVATNVHVTDFAREKIAWILNSKQAGTLSVTLLKHPENADLGFDDMMAAGYAGAKPVIVIAQPRFAGFLVEGGRLVAPFSRQQVNDFMLGLVHETVLLQNPNFVHLLSGDDQMDDHLNEAIRAWREVDVRVVRALRAGQEPMDTRFVEVDDALRSCGDRQQCKPLRALLFPNTQRP